MFNTYDALGLANNKIDVSNTPFLASSQTGKSLHLLVYSVIRNVINGVYLIFYNSQHTYRLQVSIFISFTSFDLLGVYVAVIVLK